ncbi:MAG: FkbM family methyltransferase [Ignavibacteria bacterium]|nr:FkbM family methyltransferase [Ignavibacteria bacterium]
MLKKLISKYLRKRGYQISRIRTIERRIEMREFAWLQEFGINTILDVGANEGQFAIMMNKIMYNVAIYSFEPIEHCFEELLNNTKNFDRINCFNVALGNEIKDDTIYHNIFSPSSSLLEMNLLHKKAFPYTQDSVKEQIKISTLDEMRDSMEWKKKILLKIDVQGYEMEVLKGAETSLENIDLIMVETSFFELYKKQPLFNDVYNLLYAKGFRFVGNFDQIVEPNTGRVLQADAIFIRC